MARLSMCRYTDRTPSNGSRLWRITFPPVPSGCHPSTKEENWDYIAIPSLSGAGGIDGICAGGHVPSEFLAKVGEGKLVGNRWRGFARYTIRGSGATPDLTHGTGEESGSIPRLQVSQTEVEENWPKVSRLQPSAIPEEI